METHELIIIEVFCQEYHIEVNLIKDLEEFGLIETVVYNKKRYVNINQLATIEKILRLHNELNINKEGIDVVINLLEKVNHLTDEIKQLKNRLHLYE
ncbi:chaperone modulator CbpM [Flavobacterium sp.]